jgi:importin subunit alpha-1
VLDAGILPLLVKCLREQDKVLLFESIWAIGNLGMGSPSQTMEVINSGALPFLAKCLDSKDMSILEQTVVTLGNIAGEDDITRTAVLILGVNGRLVQIAKQYEEESLTVNVVATVSKLCRSPNKPRFELTSEFLPFLCQMANSSNQEILMDTLEAFSGMTTGLGEEGLNAIVESGVVRRLCECLSIDKSSGTRLCMPALKTLGNLLSGNDTCTQYVLNSGFLQHIGPLLQSHKKTIVKEALWTISNITAGTNDQITCCINASLFAVIISMSQSFSQECLEEAIWVICNAVNGGDNTQVKYLVDIGVLGMIKYVLEVQDVSIVSPRLIAQTLEALELVLRKCEGAKDLMEDMGMLDTVETLQTHQDQTVYTAAVNILETHFDAEEDFDVVANMPPIGNQFNFGPPPAGNNFNF